MEYNPHNLSPSELEEIYASARCDYIASDRGPAAKLTFAFAMRKLGMTRVIDAELEGLDHEYPKTNARCVRS